MAQDVWHRHHLTVLGEGPRTVVLAHGFGCDQRAWRHVAANLAQDHRVVLFDNMGCGQSDAAQWNPRRYASLDGYAQDVIDLCEQLPWRDLVFVGHSISASIGILAAIAAPRYFDRLILLAPSPRFLNDPPDYVGGFEREDIVGMLDLMERNRISWANFLAPLVAQNPDRPDLTREMTENLCSGDPTIMRHFAEVVFMSDIRAELPKLTVPALILQCSDDAIAKPEVGDYLHRHLHHSRLRLMRATGHLPHLSHPEETIDMIREGLAWTPSRS
ncbi:MAG: alpha/beta hydrolase [Rubrivivax sp.]|nr:MAG: alpha/beta hydrolase [Rubrivivax sp.]